MSSFKIKLPGVRNSQTVMPRGTPTSWDASQSQPPTTEWLNEGIQRFSATQTSSEVSSLPQPSQTLPSTLTASQTSAPKGRGRRAGNFNWKPDEIDIFLRITKEQEPLGATGWQKVTAAFNDEATKHGFSQRDAGQLKRKFRALVKKAGGKKPTGKSKKSKQLRLAYEIDWAIRGRFGSGILDDSVSPNEDDDDDSDDSEEDENDDNNDNTGSMPPPSSLPQSQSQASTWYAEKPSRTRSQETEQPGRARNQATLHTLNNISNAFDPAQLRLRDLQRAEQNALLIQLNSSQAEVRRLQADIGMLRNELLDERLRAQRAEDRLEMEKENFKLRLQLVEDRYRGHHRHHDEVSPPCSRSPSPVLSKRMKLDDNDSL